MTKQILIVEDSRFTRRQVRAMLMGAGFEVIEAEDGTQAMDCLSSRSDISLVLCDLRMPKMDGLELLRRLNGRGRVPELPFLVMTTETDLEQIERARALGARGWIAKPFRAERLVATVQRVLDSPPGA